MGRETSPYIVGDFWLDKRRDGRSPDVWQIAGYEPRTRSIVYRSTRRKGLEEAKAEIHAHVETSRAQRPQTADDAKVIPLLLLYWNEHGRSVVSPAQIASSIRVFIGFLAQDRDGLDLRVADINPQLFERFRLWRMGEHAYKVPWAGKEFAHHSFGVRGETVQRNVDDVRAALNHHASNGRLPYVPKIPSVRSEFRSPAKDRVLTTAELGAIVGYCAYEPTMLRFVALMLATAVRPEAALKMNPAAQYQPTIGLLDLHPPGDPRTKKHNPVVPVIEELHPILMRWGEEGQRRVLSRKTAWRTLRRSLSLGREVEAKTIRHTVATRLRSMGVPPAEISSLLGHSVMKGSSAVYAKYDPNYLGNAKDALSTLFRETMAEAARWGAGHLRAKVGNEPLAVIDREADNALARNAKAVVGADGLEPPTLSV